MVKKWRFMAKMAKYGNEEYMRMMQDSNEIYCPDCWENKKREDD